MAVDAVILEDVLQHLHNWFDRDATTFGGRFEVFDGELPEYVSEQIPSGAWFRIEGSYLNDGLHQSPADDLGDEEFEGTITVLRVPRPLLRLVEEIGAWEAKYGQAAQGPYASESFGGYSYTFKGDTGRQDGSGGLTGWRLAFRDRLNAWRKIA